MAFVASLNSAYDGLEYHILSQEYHFSDKRSNLLLIHHTIKHLCGESVEVIIYEPTLADGSDFNGFEVENDFAKFSKRRDIIIANRLEDKLKKVSDKVYTRDLFARD